MKKENLWWLSIMRAFYGTVSMFDCRPAIPVSIDSCKKAPGAFVHGNFIHTQWKPGIPVLPINNLEVLALEPAVLYWVPLWANKKVLVHSDHYAASSIIHRA